MRTLAKEEKLNNLKNEFANIEVEKFKLDEHKNIEEKFKIEGPKAYSTAGWLGLTDNQIAKTINEMMQQGFDCFKMKVGQNLSLNDKAVKKFEIALKKLCLNLAQQIVVDGEGAKKFLTVKYGENKN